MGEFLNNPPYTPLSDGKWRLEGDLRYVVIGGLIDVELVVPAGFETDFASVPRLFWNVIGPTGTYDRAAVLHDWLYRTHGLNGRYTRAQCDALLREAMVACGTPRGQQWLIYWNVRWFGWGAWKSEPKGEV